MSSPEISINPPFKPDVKGIAERALDILPPVLTAAFLVGITYLGLKKATSASTKKS